ncbi:MAG: GGDEF domain-containing protein [candidate division WOR-3 bacterium]
MGKSFNLIIKKGEEILKIFPIKKNEILIGRNPENDLVLDDSLVSRKHCKIFLKEDSIFIEDLGSTNGTFLNGQRIKRERLKIGDEIGVGIYNLIFTTQEITLDESTKQILNVSKRLYYIAKEEREKILKLEEMALRDELTGLFTRRAFYQKIKEVLLKAEEIFILFIDIDNFKRFNDIYGHDTGDSLLVFISRILRELEDRGFVIRWGGEEFLIILPDFKKEEVIKIAEDILNKTRESSQKEIGERVTVSIGISSCKEKENIEECIKRADKALFSAKNKGKNRFEFKE